MGDLLSSFAPVFELFAAFNFAYVVSDGFTDTLRRKISSAFQIVRDKLSKCDARVEILTVSVQEIGGVAVMPIASKSTNQEAGTDIRNVIKEQIGKLMADGQKLRSNIEEEVENSNISKLFNYISLYSALYCLVLLFTSGFYSMTEQSAFDKALAVFSCCSLLFMFFALIVELIPGLKNHARICCDDSQDKKLRALVRIYRKTIRFFKPSFLKTIWFFFGLSILTFLVYCNEASSVGFKVVETNIIVASGSSWYFSFKLAVGVITMMVPTTHFVLYFFKAIMNNVKLRTQMLSKIQKYDEEIDEVNQNLKSAHNIADTVLQSTQESFGEES